MLAVSLKQDFALTTDGGKKRKQGIFKKELKLFQNQVNILNIVDA